MALPTSGPISASMIRDEFGQSNPVPISSYYRGGGIVPDIAANSNVPTSPGTISYSNFYGASNAGPNNFGFLNIQDFGFKSATAGIVFVTSGTLSYIGSNPPAAADWHAPAPVTGVGSNFWVRATGSAAGGTLSGALNTWLQLNTNRTWSVSTNIPGEAAFASLDFEIGTSSAGANAVAVGSVALTASA